MGSSLICKAGEPGVWQLTFFICQAGGPASLPGCDSQEGGGQASAGQGGREDSEGADVRGGEGRGHQ